MLLYYDNLRVWVFSLIQLLNESIIAMLGITSNDFLIYTLAHNAQTNKQTNKWVLVL